jgi:hypothetical protein
MRDGSYNIHVMCKIFRSEWPRGLRHEMSSPARSKVGIAGSNPTQSMDVCLCLFCVCIGLRWADPPPKESYRLS